VEVTEVHGYSRLKFNFSAQINFWSGIFLKGFRGYGWIKSALRTLIPAKENETRVILKGQAINPVQ
jgi:hypothetical protein